MTQNSPLCSSSVLLLRCSKGSNGSYETLMHIILQDLGCMSYLCHRSKNIHKHASWNQNSVQMLRNRIQNS